MGDKASEIIVRNAAWLSGKEDLRFTNSVTPSDFDGVTDSQFRAAYYKLTGIDFTDSQGKGIDAEFEVRRKGNLGNKVTAQHSKKVAKPGSPTTNAEVANTIAAEVNKTGSFDKAVQNAESLGKIKKPQKGKLLKKTQENGIFVPKYNTLIKPEVLEKDAKANLQTDRHISKRDPSFRLDKTVVEPIGFKEIDLDSVRSQDGSFSGNDVRITGGGDIADFQGGKSNYGRTLHINLDLENPAVSDITRKGYTEQLIRRPQYVQTSRPTDIEKLKMTKPQNIDVDSKLPDISEAPISSAARTSDEITKPGKPLVIAEGRRQGTIKSPPTVEMSATAPKPKRFGNLGQKVPRGEGGFIAAPGRSPVTTFAGTRAIPKVKGVGKFGRAVAGDGVSELVIGAGISYLTGESNNIPEAVISAAGSAITSDNTGGADMRTVNGVQYHYDPAKNMLRDLNTGAY